MFERILVACDGSEPSSRALERAAELAVFSSGEVRVLHVREEHFVGRAGPIPSEGHDAAVKIVDDAIARIGQSGAVATGTVRASLSGRVAVEIVDEALEWDASVIVVGSRGLTEIASLILGSTTHKVLHLSKLPVLVVP